jgi:adenylate kinase
MAPITDDVVSGLKDTIGKLEARVVELEGRLTGSKPKSVTEQIRVILMGPPGAGMGIGTLQLDLYELC